MFENFYNHPVIQALAPNERWTISNDKKVPLDVTEYLNTKDTSEPHIWGLAYTRGHNPCVNLQTLVQAIPNAMNNTYYLNYQTDNIVIMDIEPDCPDVLKNEFLKLPYLYGETSMSGKGYHLVFPVPDCLVNYPIAQKKLALKEQHGYYEILLNHMLTFTRNMLPPQTPELDIQVFNNIFEILAEQAIETKNAESLDIDADFDPTTIYAYHELMKAARRYVYAKKPEDFNNDMSRYEYGFIGGYYNHIKRVIQNYPNLEKQHTYTDTELVWLTYSIVKEKIEPREKHETIRNGMPWLLYLTENLIAKDIINNQTQ